MPLEVGNGNDQSNSPRLESPSPNRDSKEFRGLVEG